MDINYINEKDLTPCDVLLCYSEHLAGKNEYIRNGYSHVAIIAGDRSVIDSDSSGVQKKILILCLTSIAILQY
jgi:cell wall-associated NlpC family hydrolase